MHQSAALCLTLWIGLCSGCAAYTPEPGLVPEPVVIRPIQCPRPLPPELPRVSGVSFLESREAYTLLLQRDARIRAYIKGLEAALSCYEAQTAQGEKK